jgi:protein-S-isoprenylcysteine O-methyltransferase Ste14
MAAQTTDVLIYAAHAAFWTSFGLARWLSRDRAPAREEPPAAQETQTAPYSRAVFAPHFLAFGLMYWGLGTTVFSGQVPRWFPGQALAGTAVIAAGAALCSWALSWFQSWRFRAQLDAGHRLATGGPFHFLRNPIYMGLNFLALGSALWVPTAPLWIAVVLMALGSDLRARSEEVVLARAFGAAYAEYRSRTRRFIPGIY